LTIFWIFEQKNIITHEIENRKVVTSLTNPLPIQNRNIYEKCKYSLTLYLTKIVIYLNHSIITMNFEISIKNT